MREWVAAIGFLVGCAIIGGILGASLASWQDGVWAARGMGSVAAYAVLALLAGWMIVYAYILERIYCS